MCKMIFIDVEPTGLGWDKKNCILELGAEIWIRDNGEFRKCGDFYVKMKPIDDVKYQVNIKNGTRINYEKAQRHLKPEMNALSNNEGFMKFIEWLDKWINPIDKEDKAWFMAYNTKSRMDETLVRNFFERNQNPYFHAYFDYDKICIKEHAINFLKGKVRLLTDRRLSTIYQYLMGKDINTKQLHSANYDCMLAAELYFEVDRQRDEMIRQSIIESNKE